MNTAASEQTTAIDDFLVARGGPFYNLQKRLGLTPDHKHRARVLAAIFVGLAWGVPLVLSAIDGKAWGTFSDNAYLLSLGPWAKFLIAIAIFILMESAVEQRLRTLFSHFERAPIVEARSLPAAAEAVKRSHRFRDSALAECICFVIAFLTSIPFGERVLSEGSSGWATVVTAEGTALTPAGWWGLLVSNPLFVFLFSRWLWRFFVWCQLLRSIAKLDLRLVASHPDGRGGLAFIGHYLGAFALFVLAISSVIGAVVAHEMLVDGISATTFAVVLAGWLLIVLGLLSYPLLAFRKPLADLRTEALSRSSARATEHFQAVEAQVLRSGNSTSDDHVSEQEIVPDPTAVFESADKLSVNLLNRSAVISVVIAAATPLLAAGLTQVPLEDVAKVIKRLLTL